MASKKSKKNKKKKFVIFAVEIVVILAMLVVLMVVMQGTGGFGDSISSFFNPSSGPKVTVIDEEELQKTIVDQVQQEAETGSMKGFINIALFGVDASKESELYKSSRSDSTMIASINTTSGDIKLCSVYRDTYVNIGTDSYQKLNAAYSKGGAEQAIKMLNMNLDMNIEKFVAVGYKGLSEVIDGLGGVYIDVDETELKHINNYQIDIAKKLNKDYTAVTSTGLQCLNGIQAAAYCRIRYGGGDDFLRTSRQREVLLAIEAQAKQTDLATLTEVYNAAMDDIYTNLDKDTIMSLITNIANYRVVDQDGFPQEDMRTTANVGATGSCVIPTTLASNVEWLHQFFFDDYSYSVSSTVQECSDTIAEKTAPYINKSSN